MHVIVVLRGQLKVVLPRASLPAPATKAGGKEGGERLDGESECATDGAPSASAGHKGEINSASARRREADPSLPSKSRSLKLVAGALIFRSMRGGGRV